jgi:hypothetical protein
MDKVASLFKRVTSKIKSSKLTKPSWFSTLDESRAPNVKQYLRGLRNYHLLSTEIKVRAYTDKFVCRETLQLLQFMASNAECLSDH